MAARGLARVRAIPLRSTRVACRSYRAHPSAFNHCVDLVNACEGVPSPRRRQHDPERYICNLHAPKSARSGLFALHAFNLETSRIKSSTTDKNIGRMRLLWWRQALAQTAEGSPPDQPVLHALAHSGAQYRWTWRYLEQLLDAREADLELTQPSSQAELLSYCERTAGSLSLLACECANSKEATSFNVEVAEQAALHVGAALGIATLLRGLPLHCAQGCSYIPEDVAARHGLTLKEVREKPVKSAHSSVRACVVTHVCSSRRL
ncbi:MAG: hypothetical protein SGPRY_007574 [Prymnesium sp.]